MTVIAAVRFDAVCAMAAHAAARGQWRQSAESSFDDGAGRLIRHAAGRPGLPDEPAASFAASARPARACFANAGAAATAAAPTRAIALPVAHQKMEGISIMRNEKSTVFSTLALGAGLLICAELAGCGGDDPKPAVQASEFPSCRDTPRVAAVDGYPLYRVSSASLDKCMVAAYYDAGYAIVADGDVDVWGPTDAMPVFQFDSGVAAMEPSGAGSDISTVPVPTSTPVATKDEQPAGFVMAKSPGDDAPVECQLQNGGTDGAAIDNCLRVVREHQSRQRQGGSTTRSAGIRAAASDDPTTFVGDTRPDPAAWTLLGKSTQAVKLESYSDNWWQADQKTGSATLQFSLYRLNSNTQNDFYLVKAMWETTPVARVNKTHPTSKDACVKGDYCGYYNNLHEMGFSLSVVRNGVVVAGDIESYMPHSVGRNKTVAQKMGGELSFGEKSVGVKVSGEVSTTYNYPALDLLPSASNGTVQFKTSHATGANDIWNADPTTVGSAGTVAWALFRVPEGDPAVEESVRINVSKFEGSFGLRSDNDLISHLYLYSYKLAKPYTISYSPPVFGVKVVNDDGTTRPVPVGRNNAIRLKAGESTELAISAGDFSTPIRVAWQVTNLPDWVVTSVDKGSMNSGDARVVVTVRPNTAPGTLGYVMLNTSPRAATASMRNQDIAVPIQVVQ